MEIQPSLSIKPRIANAGQHELAACQIVYASVHGHAQAIVIVEKPTRPAQPTMKAAA